ncbi:MAG: ABC transporter ATP-binding protein [Chloroflexi bacterium]|nr:MAG: ABC transporter ATP-binding protein [Chloroflexota bacterium]
MSANQQTTTQKANLQAHGTRANDEAIVVDNFSKSYGSHPVVDQLHFTVHRGEVFALLGPNGAGKTTTVETLEGYTKPDQGSVRVLGRDPIREAQSLKPLIGVMLQQDGLYPALTAREILRLYAGYFREPQNIDALLECVGFLDEPTAGMDPQARLATWEIIRDLKQRGATVLLTTHLMDEAERLADRVAIIDHGRLVALDTPSQMMGVQNATTVRFVAPTGLDCTQLAALPAAQRAEEIRPSSYLIETEAVPTLLAELTAWLRDNNITLSELHVGHGSLEDLFLRLTGAEVRE